MAEADQPALDTLPHQERPFPPPAYWAEQARRLSRTVPFTQVLEYTGAPHTRWLAA
jgi:hypothetical protein